MVYEVGAQNSYVYRADPVALGFAVWRQRRVVQSSHLACLREDSSPQQPGDCEKTVGFAPPDPASFADQVVAGINNGEDAPEFELVSPGKAWLTGRLSYTAATEAGQHTIWLNLHNGSARIETRPKSNEELIERPSFAGSKVDVKIPGLDGAERKLLKLLEQANINPSEEVKLRLRPSPQLLFQVRGRDGQLWNATCNLLNGRLDGRATEMGARLDLRSAIIRVCTNFTITLIILAPDGCGRWLRTPQV